MDASVSPGPVPPSSRVRRASSPPSASPARLGMAVASRASRRVVARPWRSEIGGGAGERLFGGRSGWDCSLTVNRRRALVCEIRGDPRFTKTEKTSDAQIYINFRGRHPRHLRQKVVGESQPESLVSRKADCQSNERCKAIHTTRDCTLHGCPDPVGRGLRSNLGREWGPPAQSFVTSSGALGDPATASRQIPRSALELIGILMKHHAKLLHLEYGPVVAGQRRKFLRSPAAGLSIRA